MTKKIKDSLTSSLNAEQEAVEKRFSKVEEILKQSSQRLPAHSSKELDLNIVKIRRDGFSMTEEDYQLVQNIINQFLSLGINPKRSEIYRLAIHVLAQQSKEVLAKEFKKIHILKPGRK